MIAGLPARKSIVTVNYVTSMPLENDRILVQQKNDIEIWHTSGLVLGRGDGPLLLQVPAGQDRARCARPWPRTSASRWK